MRSTVFARYFDDMTGIGLLSKEEEVALARRIGEHIKACVSTLVILVTASEDILKRRQDQHLPGQNRKITSFREHPHVVEAMSSQSIGGDEGLRKIAKHLMRSFNPANLKGAELEDELTKLVRSEHCAKFLSKFVGSEAKRDFDTMVMKNLRLVVNISRKFHGLPKEDLVQEGNRALLTAVARFDIEKGYRFSTYASWWIRHHMARAISNSSRIIRIPVHAEELRKKMRKASTELTRLLQRKPTPREIAERIGVPEERIVKRIADPEVTVSLNKIVGVDMSETEGTPLLNMLRAPEEETLPTEYVLRKQEATLLMEALKVLIPTERDIIERRFGLKDENPLTLQEIAGDYNLSRERIRQIQEVALEKLRKKLSHIR